MEMGKLLIRDIEPGFQIDFRTLPRGVQLMNLQHLMPELKHTSLYRINLAKHSNNDARLH